jgi:hypothetical protein
MLVLPFPGKQMFARACRASSPILPSPRDAAGDRFTRRCLKIIGAER